MQAKTPWPQKWPALNSRINFHLLRLLAKLHDQREYCCLIAFFAILKHTPASGQALSQ